VDDDGRCWWQLAGWPQPEVAGLVQHLRSRTHRHRIASGASASEILDRRFASGEIDADKYQRLRTTLAQTPNETRPGSESAAGALT
jgi:hypothetical protein